MSEFWLDLMAGAWADLKVIVLSAAGAGIALGLRDMRHRPSRAERTEKSDV